MSPSELVLGLVLIFFVGLFFVVVGGKING